VVPFADGVPRKTSANQGGFVEFGLAHVQALVTEVDVRALKAVWYQKWQVHWRMRPEEFGGRVHNHIVGAGVTILSIGNRASHAHVQPTKTRENLRDNL
jgi:hypothetical protein